MKKALEASRLLAEEEARFEAALWASQELGDSSLLAEEEASFADVHEFSKAFCPALQQTAPSMALEAEEVTYDALGHLLDMGFAEDDARIALAAAGGDAGLAAASLLGA